ncbi:cache domain-containing protein [Halocynthiibacter sp. C4]|uniref:cache domain-containing protein n=1 Tax=Halocynthiibacter sp. C4 TaxID=2992758 RepID=UPI00237A1140|nr:cache domain-containing protein [Halocynthiibacter sp. C4]MDE0589773.1 cache domain-containing protein [Halocynthiibacter sp. C4]
MSGLLARLNNKLHLSYGQKVFLLASVPLIVAAAAISVVVTLQSQKLADQEIGQLEHQLIEAKKTELKNYVNLARSAFFFIYGRAAPDDYDAKLRVTQILSAMTFGEDGSYFVFDYDGNNLVSPRRTELITKNWAGLADEEGTPIVDTLIAQARTGAGYHTFLWEKPSTGETGRMIAYVIGLQNWRWAVGTGVFIDDVLGTVATARATVEERIQATFVYIMAITLGALLVVFFSGLLLNIRERRLADAKLKTLTQRIFDTQEEERGRVARELHDSISQILVGVRYALELARRKIANGDATASDSLEKGVSHLNGAIQEVRRISRDLRPGILDDLGLGPALQSLTKDFTARTGIKTDFETAVFRNRLDQESKIALYRIAQEALTNIERHSGATYVSMRISGHKRGATMRIADNGHGLPDSASLRRENGIGLRNMQERVEQLDGTLRLTSSAKGTVIEVRIPLSHLLAPERPAKEIA